MATGVFDPLTTGNPYINGLLASSKWVGQVTFSFPQSLADYPARYYESPGDPNGLDPEQVVALNFQQQELVRAILTGQTSSPSTQNVMRATSVVSFTNLEITEAGGLGNGLNGTGDIRAAVGTWLSSGGTFFPAPNNPIELRDDMGGDVWLGLGTLDARLGTFGYYTIVHELGHALGLKHPHDPVLMPGDGNSVEFTMMSYNHAVDEPETFMMYDILALQTRYGADYGPESNNTETVYTWNTSTGETFINGISQGDPVTNKVFLTIWDGGGQDTYDMSNQVDSVSIDLNPGKWSTFEGPFLRPYMGNGQWANGNVYNSLLFNGDPRSLIENAIGGSGDDTLIGNEAANSLVGNGGHDSLDGGDGNDILVGGAGADILVGSSGVDAASYASASTIVRVSLADPSANTGDAAGDTYSSIENLIGSSFNDRLTGNGAANSLFGGLGNDTLVGGGNIGAEGGIGIDPVWDILDGGSGSDTADYSWALPFMVGTVGPYGVTVDLILAQELAPGTSISASPKFPDAPGVPLPLGQYNLQVLQNIENLSGSQWADTLAGDGNANVLIGEYGSDHLSGRGGNDTLIGGSDPLGLLDNSIDTLVGGGGDDTLYGGAGDDALLGDGQPTVADGDDILDGGPGNDILDGNDGIDTASYLNATAGVVVNLLSITAIEGTWTDTLNNIENVIGSSFADVLTGNAISNALIGGDGNDVLIGGAGNDQLLGGFGSDRAQYAGNLSSYSVSSQPDGTWTIADNRAGSPDGTDTLGSVEKFVFADQDMIIGTTAANNFPATGVPEVFIGGSGQDTVSYADATVTITGLMARAVIETTSGLGLTASLADPSINTGWAAGDTYISIENLIGSDFDDRLFGDANNNVLEGGAGRDQLNGGQGIDTASYEHATSAVAADLSQSKGNTGEAAGDTYKGIENLLGSSFNDRLVGSGSNNTLTGGDGDDTLFGKDGNDQLIGGLGADILQGGAGTDQFIYLSADDSQPGIGFRDQISDFNTKSGDTIDLTQVDANLDEDGDQDFGFIGKSAFSGTAGELRYTQEKGFLLLAGDLTGDSVADFEIQVSGAKQLVVDDFLGVNAAVTQALSTSLPQGLPDLASTQMAKVGLSNDQLAFASTTPPLLESARGAPLADGPNQNLPTELLSSDQLIFLATDNSNLSAPPLEHVPEEAEEHVPSDIPPDGLPEAALAHMADAALAHLQDHVDWLIA